MGLLSILSVFDNCRITYCFMALTILAECPSISPSSELSEKLVTCSYKLFRSSWSLAITAAKLSTGSNGDNHLPQYVL